LTERRERDEEERGTNGEKLSFTWRRGRGEEEMKKKEEEKNK